MRSLLTLGAIVAGITCFWLLLATPADDTIRTVLLAFGIAISFGAASRFADD